MTVKELITELLEFEMDRKVDILAEVVIEHLKENY